MTRRANNCNHCAVKEGRWQCSNCLQVLYCGMACQRADWSNHRAMCFQHNASFQKREARAIQQQLARKAGHRWRRHQPLPERQSISAANRLCNGIHFKVRAPKPPPIRVPKAPPVRRVCPMDKKLVQAHSGQQSRHKKSVKWPSDFASEQEVLMARLCSFLKADETVTDAVARLHRLAQQGDQVSRLHRREVVNCARLLRAKGQHYIYRTKRRFLENLALDTTDGKHFRNGNEKMDSEHTSHQTSAEAHSPHRVFSHPEPREKLQTKLEIIMTDQANKVGEITDTAEPSDGAAFPMEEAGMVALCAAAQQLKPTRRA
eukprot:CAMPEP_0170183254 /NCGR_PEP_ID=MMETSP0040_2-20121228/30108_1 /TAXON_ID=641309 /ORGANISM="Lotharella oceanica, Strain CCMP622" /LENGTH=316 /DNA_ID=CAMNT_0010428931 /DNA_START=87 /DNA_END=1037 /DNA_ORIENTATION=-